MRGEGDAEDAYEFAIGGGFEINRIAILVNSSVKVYPKVGGKGKGKVNPLYCLSVRIRCRWPADDRWFRCDNLLPSYYAKGR